MWGPWSRLGREPGPNLTLRLGARSGHVARPRCGHQLPCRMLPNSDCVLFMGSNMAEAHPVGFRWPMKAKERGATLIHIDPHFSRTSALCDLYVPIRAGSDIAFLGGMINYVLTHDRWFKEYVLHYTNAATLIQEGFQDTEDLGGLFSGLDPETGVYDPVSGHWGYEGSLGDRDGQDGSDEKRGAGRTDSPAISPEDRKGVHGYAVDGGARPHDVSRSKLTSKVNGEPPGDPTLQNPRCVFQILKRHFSRYTPEMVAQVCGCSPEQFTRVAELLLRQLGPRADERPGLCPGVDPACRGRTDDSSRGHLAALARQHRPSRRRYPGHARPFQHPGLDGHRDLVRRPARLSAPTRGRWAP